MAKKEKTVQAGDAAYGQALLCNRGGWTLREMLGSDYDKFSGTTEASTDEDKQNKNQSSTAKSKKRN
jgi:hypothetical protein